MRVEGFWMGLVRLSARVDVSDLARRAGGWDALRDGGSDLWESLGLSETQRCVLHTAPSADTLGSALLADDPRYPPALAGIPGAPPVLFVEGDLAVFEAPAVAVVGTRACTSYGRGVARDLGAQLADAGVCVVSGLARGIDAAAHRGALARGRTVAVLGHGLGCTAPASHAGLRREMVRRGGAVVSAWPDAVPPRPWTFPNRNRWIAGLASHTVVVEAPARSGALHTVRSALEYGREVHVVPGLIGAVSSAGSNAALRDGAHPLTSVVEFVEHVTGAHRGREEWLSALFAGARLEDAARLRGGSVAELLEELQLMEALGRVVRLPGQRYGMG